MHRRFQKFRGWSFGSGSRPNYLGVGGGIEMMQSLIGRAAVAGRAGTMRAVPIAMGVAEVASRANNPSRTRATVTADARLAPRLPGP